MATTFTKIASVTVGAGGASSIDFTSIPSTYTDLVIKLSARSNRTGDNSDNVIVSFNGSTSSLTYRYVQGSGSGAFSSSGSTGYVGSQDAAGATSSTFGSLELYVPNYAGSSNKSVSTDSVDENNATSAYATMTATLWSNTAAITSLNLKPQVGTLFVQYSTATLYGISNT